MREIKIEKNAEIVMDNIKKRRSIRQYKPEDVPDDAIKWIIEAARWAPTAHNFQPTEYIVIRERESIEFISEIAHFTGEENPDS